MPSTDPWSTAGAYGDSLNSSNPWLAPQTLVGQSGEKDQGDQNSYLKSLTNMTGIQGRNTLQGGKDQYQGADDALQPYADYFSRLAGGDRSEALSAMGPQIDPITQQFDSIKKMFSDTGVRGGGTTSTLAQLPFQETAQISDLINKGRLQAAGAGSQLQETRAGLAQNQEQLGQGLLHDTTGTLLGERGQNFSMYDNAASRDNARRVALISALI